VRGEPDDDTARLVLADWLEENGDAHRAELIRIQCRMAQLAAAWDRSDAPTWNLYAEQAIERWKKLCPEYVPLQARAQALLAEHAGRWAAGLPAPVFRAKSWPHLGDSWTVFERGLPVVYVRWDCGQPDPAGVLSGLLETARAPAFAWVAWVALDLAARGDGAGWQEDWPAGLARHPAVALLNEIDLNWATVPLPNAISDLAVAGPLPRLHTRKMFQENTGLPPEAFYRVSNLPHLRVLDLRGSEELDGRFEKWPPFPELRRLNLRGTSVSGADLERLARSDRFPQLREINVSTHFLTPSGVLALIASSRLPGWRRFGSTTGAIPPRRSTTRSLRSSFPGWQPCRRRPGYRSCDWQLCEADVEPLLTSPHLARLGYLNIRRNPLSPGMVERLKGRFPRVEAANNRPVLTRAAPNQEPHLTGAAFGPFGGSTPPCGPGR
jgi:uncharacterized protein (TIGR02996 family)